MTDAVRPTGPDSTSESEPASGEDATPSDPRAEPGLDAEFLTRARLIAQALSRTAEHHRRSALLAGVIALGGCLLAFLAGRPAAKAVALALGVLFAVFCYRSTRSANLYIDPGASPVLAAITSAPEKIRSIVFDAARSVLTIGTEGAELEVRIDEHTEVEPLIAALKAHAPKAKISREPTSDES
jgi:hypothetical protein